MVAGFWRRVAIYLIDGILTTITFGIYGFVFFILFFFGTPTIGMRAVNVKYSNKSRQVFLFLFFILELFFYILIIPIIYDLIQICIKRGTFAERWSKDFLVRRS